MLDADTLALVFAGDRTDGRMTMTTTDHDTDRAPDLAKIWADIGVSIEAFVRRRINDPHRADDVVADVMVRIHRHLSSLDDHERVTAWVYRITRNAIIDDYRRSGRRREVLESGTEPGAASSADAWVDDQAATLSELAACVRPLVAALPADYRRALELTEFQGLTQAEAATIEGVSLTAMKSRVQRGRRQIATLLGQCCEVTTDVRGAVVDFRVRRDDCGCPPGEG